MSPAAGCLSENAILDLVRGAMPTEDARTAQEHVDGCAICFRMVAEAAAHAPALGEDPSPPTEVRLGKYLLEQRLGAGGMGEVFIARQTGPGGFEKRCVVKRILPELAADPSFAEMFFSEARLAGQLDHPHIVHVFDFGEAEGSYYLAMEYVPGSTLAEVIRALAERAEWLPFAVAARIVSQAAMAIDYAHAAPGPDGRALHLVHRDVSPENIMLSTAGSVKLLDFGVAKARWALAQTRAGIIKGKASYMSPEQALGKPLDTRSDIYALGLVLYETLTDRRAIGGSGVERAAYPTIRPLADFRPGVPAALEAIVRRALEKEADRRFSHAGAMSAELERYITGSGETVTPRELIDAVQRVSGPRVTEPAPGARTLTASGPVSSRRRVRMVPLMMVGVGAFAAVTVGALWGPSRPAPVAPNVPAIPLLPPPGLAPSPPPQGVPDPAPVEPVTAEVPDPEKAPHHGHPQRFGTLVVESSLKLEALVDGKRVGQTPLRVALEPGPHALILRDDEKELFRSQQVHIEAGRSTSQRWEPGKGTVAFRVLPYGEVSYRGHVYGTTPLDPIPMWEGRHTLSFKNPENGRSATREVDVRPGVEAVVKVDLR